jgi:putative phosphoesterase
LKIAVLSDIHGNIAALEPVLREAKEAGVKRLFVLGDMIDYYYQPDAVLAALEPWDKVVIQGNHERFLIPMGKVRDKSAILATYKLQFGSGLIRVLDLLNQEQIDMLLNLPMSVTVEADGAKCLLAHGSPQDPDEYVYPDAPSSVKQRCLEVDADFVFLGHTHRPFSYEFAGKMLVNVGSVGQARDHGGAASWALLDTKARTVELQKTPYDIRSVVAEAMEFDPHLPFLVDVLKRP